VAVRAEHTEIFDPMIVLEAIDVVDLYGQRMAPPFTEATQVATIRDYTSPKQMALDR